MQQRVAAVTAGTLADDPIHEAIAAHKQAMEAWDANWQKVVRTAHRPVSGG